MRRDQAKPSQDVRVLPAIRTAMQMSRLTSSLPASPKSDLTIQSCAHLRTKYHRQRTELTSPVTLTPHASSGRRKSDILVHDSSRVQETSTKGQEISLSTSKTWELDNPRSAVKQYDDALESFSSLQNTPKRRNKRSVPISISLAPKDFQTATSAAVGNTVVVTPVHRVFTVDSEDLDEDDKDVHAVLVHLREKKSQKTLAPLKTMKAGKNTAKYSVKISYCEDTAEVLGNTRNQARRRSERTVLPGRLFRHIPYHSISN